MLYDIFMPRNEPVEAVPSVTSDTRDKVLIRMSQDLRARVKAYADTLGVPENAALCVLLDLGLRQVQPDQTHHATSPRRPRP